MPMRPGSDHAARFRSDPCTVGRVVGEDGVPSWPACTFSRIKTRALRLDDIFWKT